MDETFDHITWVAQVSRSGGGRPRTWCEGRCSCGWAGPIRPYLGNASLDASGHEAAEYVASLPTPVRGW
jgi:hypothetical protein